MGELEPEIKIVGYMLSLVGSYSFCNSLERFKLVQLRKKRHDMLKFEH
jgi:hypothetical protein